MMNRVKLSIHVFVFVFRLEVFRQSNTNSLNKWVVRMCAVKRERNMDKDIMVATPTRTEGERERGGGNGREERAMERASGAR